MSISSRNIFNYDSLLSKRIQLDNREYQIRQRERDLLGQALAQRNAQPDQQAALIRSQRFFELGFEEGFKRAQAGETEVPDLGGLFSIFAGALIRGNVRAEGGPVKKGEPYVVGEKGPELIVPSESGNVIPNDEVSPYFEASIKRQDGFLKKKSFFGNKSETEISSLDGSDYFKTITDLSGGIDTKTIQRKNITETDEYGGVTNLSIDKEYTEKTTSIGVPDLIEHQDQLLGEIKKLKGFENVTIDQVINQTTGIPQEKLLPILMGSDARKATRQKQKEARKLDLEARGIKPGEGFSMGYGDEIAQSLAGTSGYRIGQINPDMLVSSMESFKEKSVQTYDSDGLVKGDTENNEYSNLASSINQSVGANRVKTLIQPVIQNQITQVPTPVPIAQPVAGSVTRMKRSELPNNIAKLIQ